MSNKSIRVEVSGAGAGPGHVGLVDRVLPRKEVEQLLGVSTSNFYRDIRHQLPIVQLSRRRIGVRVSDLNAWLRRKTSPPTSGA